MLFAVLGYALSGLVSAEQISVAVASNFQPAMKEIADQFETATGHDVVLSPGSSGKLYAQIVNGAPFHVFFSADRQKPLALVQQGLGVPETLFTYAVGKLVLWTPESGVDVQSVLRASQYKTLALANPRLAPYGLAAMDVLEALEPAGPNEQQRWVTGENIAQTWHFVSTGNANLGFVAMSQLLDNNVDAGSVWVVPQALYEPILQDAIVITHNRAVAEFMDFVKGEEGREIITSFGYEVEQIR